MFFLTALHTVMYKLGFPSRIIIKIDGSIFKEWKHLPQRYFSDWPGGVVGQMGRQDADAQLRVPVEVEEAVRAVDVVEGGEGGDAPVDGHGMEAQLTAARQEQPVGIRA